MRILYFDCFSGASGDMILGALLDAGLPLEALRDALGSLGIDEYELGAERVLRAGVSATRFRLVERDPASAGHPAGDGRGRVNTDAEPGRAEAAGHDQGAHHHHPHTRDDPDHPHNQSAHDADARAAAGTRGGPTVGSASYGHGAPVHHHHAHAHRTVAEIVDLIGRSALSPSARARATALFTRLAEAEAGIHQMPVERVHLHEVGALDSIIDVVGAVFAIDWFGADRVVVSPMNVGSGMVRSAHGVFPVPAPATVRLLGDAPVYSRGAAELLTPTGALLLTGYASAYGLLPPMRIARVGYGAGERDVAETPNVLRVFVGEADAAAAFEPPSGTLERIVTLACEIDDMNPQIFGVLMDDLYAAGALEVFYQSVQMKKNRPGTLVTVLAPVDRRRAVTDLLFRETTTIGVRVQEVTRERLEREVVAVDTPLGPVRFKIARRDGRIVNASPEFDDCARIARAGGTAVKDVQAAAIAAWTAQNA